MISRLSGELLAIDMKEITFLLKQFIQKNAHFTVACFVACSLSGSKRAGVVLLQPHCFFLCEYKLVSIRATLFCEKQ